jgi:hypothetical protein
MIKYNFSQSGTEDVVDDFINKMTQHLVPKYFSRIEKAYTTAGRAYVQGYDDEDVLIFKLRTYTPQTASDISEASGVSFYNKASGTWKNVQYFGEAFPTFLITSYINTGGIFFRFYRNGGYISPTVLCFDDKNSTAFLTVSSENTSGSASNNTVSTYSQSGSLSYNVCYNDRDNASGSYYLMPFLTYNGTLKRVWYPIIEQYNSTSECMRIMQLDNKDYFVMPAFLIEDF